MNDFGSSLFSNLLLPRLKQSNIHYTSYLNRAIMRVSPKMATPSQSQLSSKTAKQGQTRLALGCPYTTVGNPRTAD